MNSRFLKIFPIALVFTLISQVYSQDLQWFNQIKNVYDDVDAHSITVDVSGNAYVGGSFDDQKSLGVDNGATSEVDFMGDIPTGNTHEQMGYISRVNSDGTLAWIKKFGSPNSTVGFSPLTMVEQNGSLYVAGSFQFESGSGMDFDPDAGTLYRKSLSTGTTDFFVLKLNSATGAIIWAYTGCGGAGHDLPIGIDVDENENIYLFGQVSNGTPPSAALVDFNIKNPIGDANQIGISGAYHLYIVKYDKDCNFIWRKNIVNSSSCENSSGALVIDDVNSRFYITGSISKTSGGSNPNFSGTLLTVNTSGNMDGFLAQYDLDGNLQWVKNIVKGSAAVDNYAKYLDIDGSGNVYVGGSFSGTADFDPTAGTSNLSSGGTRDGFVAKYDASGNRVWSYKIGSTAYEDGLNSLQVTNSGNIIIGGNIADVTDANPEGTGGAQNKGGTGQSIFFGEYDKDFKYQWAYAIAPTSGTNGYYNFVDCVAIDKYNDPYPVFIFGYMGYTLTQNFNPSGAGPFGPGLGPQTSTGPASSTYTNGFLAKYSTQISLPTELISFGAFCNKNKIEVKWTTASESNNDYFTLERSYDATNFEIITIISGAGNSNGLINYSFEDSEVNTFPAYYRLKQTDFNGKYEYSPVKAINCNEEVTEEIHCSQSGNLLSISFTSGKSRLCTILICDILGKELMEKTIHFKEGLNFYYFDISEYEAGLYFIILQDNTVIIKKKFLISK